MKNYELETNPICMTYCVVLVLFGAVIWGVVLSTLTHFGKKVLTEKALRYVSLVSGLILISFGLFFGYAGLAGA